MICPARIETAKKAAPDVEVLTAMGWAILLDAALCNLAPGRLSKSVSASQLEIVGGSSDCSACACGDLAFGRLAEDPGLLARALQRSGGKGLLARLGAEIKL